MTDLENKFNLQILNLFIVFYLLSFCLLKANSHKKYQEIEVSNIIWLGFWKYRHLMESQISYEMIDVINFPKTVWQQYNSQPPEESVGLMLHLVIVSK